MSNEEATGAGGHMLCEGLPSKPLPRMGKILVTGASGYIGGQLVPELLARGYEVRVMVRAASPEYRERWPNAEIVVADALEYRDLTRALAGIHTAYYLLHSLLLGTRAFESADLQAAANFRKAAMLQGLKRVVYLGGLGDVRAPLSRHLRSRIRIAEELQAGEVPTTILRAAIIIGAGSASYEIVEHLIKAAPFLALPAWAGTRCQPIGVRDVVRYLVGVLETPETSGCIYDIGGSDVMTYEEMLRVFAELLGKKLLLVRSPFAGLWIYSYIASLLTPVPSAIISCLMEGLKNDVVCHDDTITEILPFRPDSYKASLLGAMSREEQDNVSSRWSDAYPPAHELAIKLQEVRKSIRYSCRYSRLTDQPAESLFREIARIGGKDGWFHSNWLWRLRGMLDSLLMGVGTSRGRRSASTLRINDVIGFWRVEELEWNRMLLLRAEMKLPGKAWLQFKIDRESQKTRIAVSAYFSTGGFWGPAYWHACWPLHHFVFVNLLKEIERRAVAANSSAVGRP